MKIKDGHGGTGTIKSWSRRWSRRFKVGTSVRRDYVLRVTLAWRRQLLSRNSLQQPVVITAMEVSGGQCPDTRLAQSRHSDQKHPPCFVGGKCLKADSMLCAQTPFTVKVFCEIFIILFNKFIFDKA